MGKGSTCLDDERAVSLRHSDCVENDGTFDPFDPSDSEPDDCARALAWLRAFTLPEVAADVQPLDNALPGYLKQGLRAVGDETRCRVVAVTATGALHRGLEWLEQQPEVPDIARARETVERCGWPTSALEWSYTLRGCGPKDHIVLRHVGKHHTNRVHRLKDVLGLSLRVTGGLCILFGTVDLNLRGAVGRQATEQAREFLAELESRLVLAKEIAQRAAGDPAPVTSTPRNQLRKQPRPMER